MRIESFIVLGWAAFVAASVEGAGPTLQPLYQTKWPTNQMAVGVQDVKVAGRYAFLADNTKGLIVLDVEDPTHFRQVGGLTNYTDVYTLAVRGDYAYLADQSFGIQVINIHNVTNCVRVGGYASTNVSIGIALAGNYAYIADGLWGLQVIDITNPTNCVRVGGCATPGEVAYAAAVAGNYVYLASAEAGLHVIDVRDPAHCVLVGSYVTPGSAVDVAISGNYAYVADWYSGLQVFNITNPTNCVLVGGYSTPGGGGARRVAIRNNYVYVPGDFNWPGHATRSGLEVIDASNPTNCVEVNHLYTQGGAYGVAVTANGIYIADLPGGLVSLLSLDQVQFSVRVNGSTNVPFTIETATNISPFTSWTPVLTTNVTVMPFDYTDLNVNHRPRKFYRVHQP